MSKTIRLAFLTIATLLALLIPPLARTVVAQPSASAATRPKVGVALGGGSARGIAHVGVLRWLDEHRIPVDVIAGTSMGGLIGGSFATGMTPDEIDIMLSTVDWDAMFGSSNFAFKSIRRKRDARDYPSHLEFGLKGGIAGPTSLNSGQQVDLLLARVAVSSYALDNFDQLPTPFRAVAMDLRTATVLVLDRGSLAQAMRATMSLPLIFPPVEVDGRILVDGGAMNNVPADVARTMGADRVIAVNVGDLTDRTDVKYSMLGLAGETLDAMMRANALRALGGADVVINVPLSAYGSLDWRRDRELIIEGYNAAEAMRDRLLPLAVDDAAWQAWVSARATARNKTLPTPTGVSVEGAGSSDDRAMRRVLEQHVGHALDLPALDADLTMLAGLDRYQSLTWQMVRANGADRLLVQAKEKKYGPPFVYFGLSLENTTTNDVRFSLAGRYLAFDVAGSGSELRLDGSIGSDPSVGIALHRPLGSTPIFVEPFAGITTQTLNLIQDDKIVAVYGQTHSAIGVDAGINLGRLDDIRLRTRFGRLDAGARIGETGLPEVSGDETVIDLRWGHDGQDSPVVPSRGIHSQASIQHFLSSPRPSDGFLTPRSTDGVTQAEMNLSSVWSVGDRARGRVFVTGGAGTSFDGHPLATEQFALGGPFRLGAFNAGEQRGDHYVVATGGYLRQVMRLPDFLGGPVYLGGWLDTGTAFNVWKDADYAVHASSGIVADTLLGPTFVAASAGFDGNWRVYFGIGRVFR